MEKYGFKNVRVKDPSTYEIKVIDQKITVAQINRGPADMAKYRSALLSAEARSHPNRSLYYNLIENIMTDGILDALLDKRIRAVAISPPSLEGTEDEKIIKLFKAPWLTKLLRYMMESKFWGNSLIEMEYNMKALADPELEQLFKIHLVPRRNVHPEQGIISIHPDQPSMSGIPYREEPFSNFLLEFGEARELGKFVNLIPYVLFKRNNWSDFAQFNELFGMPLRMYEYDPHNIDTRKQVEEQAKKAGAAPYVIVPKGTGVQHITGNTSSGSGGYAEFNSIMNQELTISILGQTLTTGADGKGSYALGDIHKDVEEAINLEDKVWIEYQMNWVVKPMLIKTFGLTQLKGLTWKFDDTIKLTPTEKADIMVKLDGITPLDQQYIRDEFNLPDPDEESVAIWMGRKTPQTKDEGEEMKDEGKKAAEKEEAQSPPSGGQGGRGPGKPTALALAEYGGYDHIPDTGKTIELASTSSKARAEVIRIIQAIYEGRMTPDQVPATLVQLVYKDFQKAIKTGLKVEKDQQLLKALEANAFKFSTAKEFNFIRDAFASLVDADGTIKTFELFRDEVLKIHEDYNVNWLKAEYNTAVGNSQMASKWQDFEAAKENLPYLRYRTVLDDRTRHRKYNGVTLPVDHPAWDYMTPLLEYNCRCTLQQVRSGTVTPSDQIPGREGIPQAFQFNPGKSKMIFSESHPYFINTPPELLIFEENVPIPNVRLNNINLLSTQSQSLNEGLKNILQNSDGVSDLMNKNNSVVSLRDSSQISKSGTLKFLEKITGKNHSINDTFRIGGPMKSNQNGNCGINGKFMNVKIGKGDVIEFKPVKSTFTKDETDKLISSGLSKGKNSYGDTLLYDPKTKQVFGYINENNELQPWSVSSAMEIQYKVKNIATTITHESAHMIQAWKDKDLSLWKRKTAKEGLVPSKSGPTKYGQTNYHEFFAETYTMYVYDNNGLLNKFPKLFNTFVEYVKSLDVDISTIKIAK